MSEEEESVEEESPLPEGVAEDLKSKHGPIVGFAVEGFGAFAFHKPSQATNDRLVNKANGKGSEEKSQAIRECVLSCMCWPVVTDTGKPNYAAARALFEAAPSLPQELLPEVQELAPKIDIKKL